MPTTIRILILCLFNCLVISVHAQLLGPGRVLPLNTDMKVEYFGDPFYGDGVIYRTGNNHKAADDELHQVMCIYPLDGGAGRVVKLRKPKELGDNYPACQFFYFNGNPWAAFVGWDKEAGITRLYLQRYSPDEFVPDDLVLDLGEMPLDPKEYEGKVIGPRAVASPDGKKLLLYLDALQTNNIKTALCWVLDADMNLIWKNSYLLTIHSVGANTNNPYKTTQVNLRNNGEVITFMTGIPIEPNELRTEDDGQVGVKEMRTMMDITNKLKPVTYWFNGPEMRSLYSGTEYLYVKDGGFWFKYSTYEGSGSDPIWWDITSQINEGFKEVILEKNRVVDGTYGYSFVVDKNLIPRYRNARSLTKATIGAVDDDFATIWERTDPWGGWFEPDFLVVDDHLIGWFNASEKGLSEIATGERVNFSKGDVVFGHWSKAGRTFQFLVPPGSPKKEQPLIVFYDQINAHGILYMNEGQQFNGDLMLAPFAW